MSSEKHVDLNQKTFRYIRNTLAPLGKANVLYDTASRQAIREVMCELCAQLGHDVGDNGICRACGAPVDSGRRSPGKEH